MKKLLLSLAVAAQATFSTADDKTIPLKNYEDVIEPFMSKYCYNCHDEDVQKADINLLTHPQQIGTQADAQLWQDVLDVLNLGEMPPKKAKKQPSKQEIEEILDVMSNSMKFIRQKLSDSGVKPIIRRLNRREFKATIDDLLGLDVNENNLPEDDLINNFDSVGEALTFSSLHFDKFYEIGISLAKKAVTLGEKQEPIKQRWEVETGKNKHVERVKHRSLKSLESEAKKKYSKKFDELSAAEKKGINYHKSIHWLSVNYQASPAAKTGFLTAENAHPKSKRVYINLPAVKQDGDYTITMPIGYYSAKKVTNPDVKLIVTVVRKNNGEPEEQITEFKVSNDYTKPELVKIQTRLTPEYTYQLVLSSPQKTIFKPLAWIDYVELAGPIKNEFPPKPYKAVFKGGRVPQTSDEVKDTLAKFAEKAFRGKQAEDAYLNDLLAIYLGNIERGLSTEDALIEPLAVILASPYFIYKSETENEVVEDRELAVRLSYFLWNTMPDPVFLAAAENGGLQEKKELERQVIRLLKNKRANRFLDTFVSQWLGLEKLADLTSGAKKGKGISRDLVVSAREETISYFKTLIHKNLSIKNLLNSEFVTINETMANHYGIKGVKGRHFRMVKLPKDSPYGGLMTQAAPLIITSHGGKTSPVERGAFVLRKLMNMPPNPPPPNVPSIEEKTAGELLTPRQELAVHSESAQCSTCHRKIDPLGLAFENYDALGRWRDSWKLDKRKSVKIDPSGEMYDGSVNFSGPQDLKEHLEAYTANTTEGIIEALIVYSLGRNVSFSDKPWIDRLVQNSQNNGFKLRSLLIDFMTSPEFKK